MYYSVGYIDNENILDNLEFDVIRSFRWGCPKNIHDNKCAIRRIDEIQKWLKRNSGYRILVTGKMGSGKTTFIRGLTEKFVPPTDTLLPHTTKVMPYGHYHEGSNCVFFDSPGLKDNEDSSNDYGYLKEMIKKNGEPNLLVFALKMDDYVFHDEDVEAIGNISSAFGWKIWQRAMFILTFANMVQKVGHSSDSIESKLHFSSLFDRHHQGIVESLRKSGVKNEVIDNIPVVPIGLISQEKIVSDRRGMSWIEEFWNEAFKILKTTRGTYIVPTSSTLHVDAHNNKDANVKGNKLESDMKVNHPGPRFRRSRMKKSSFLSFSSTFLFVSFIVLLCVISFLIVFVNSPYMNGFLSMMHLASLLEKKS